MYQSNPFTGEIDRDKLYGLGSSDMKSGVAAIVIAAIEFAKTHKRKYGLVLMITAGEELGFRGARSIVENDKLGPIGTIIVAEPTANYPMLGHRGILRFSATAKGVVTLVMTNLGIFDVTPEGFSMREIAPGYTPEEVQAQTDSQLVISPDLKEIEVQ